MYTLSAFSCLISFFFLTLSQFSVAQTPHTRQDMATIRQTVEQFLQIQTASLPGQTAIAVGPLATRMNLPACTTPEAFLPQGSRLWGKTTVGVRCNTPVQWTAYIPATIRIVADYVVTATALRQGQTIHSNDLVKIKGDLTTLPTGIVTDPSQAIGRTIALPLAEGVPLRQDALHNQQAIQQGQMIRLISTGPGFRVSTEARALNNANEGQIAQVRTSGGQVVSGIAKPGGAVEITH